MIPSGLAQTIKKRATEQGISCLIEQDRLVLGNGDNRLTITSPGSSFVIQCVNQHLYSKICDHYASIRKNMVNLTFILATEDMKEFADVYSDCCLADFLEDPIFENPIPKSLEETEASVKSKIRKGQDYLRERAMFFWNNRCAITGISVNELLETCHIKPWSSKDTTARERLSVDNAIILCVHLHRLLDAGFISFDEEGKMLISEKLPEECRRQFSLSPELKLFIPPSKKQKTFLVYHRENIFRC